MGKYPLKTCKHPKLKDVYEDDYFLGSIYYGKECTKCGKFFSRDRGTIELGVYR